MDRRDFPFQYHHLVVTFSLYVHFSVGHSPIYCCTTFHVRVPASETREEVKQEILLKVGTKVCIEKGDTEARGSTGRLF